MLDNTQYKVVTLEKLVTLNKISITKNYNRNIEMTIFKPLLQRYVETDPTMQWNGNSTKIVLEDLLKDEHQNGNFHRVAIPPFGTILDIPTQIWDKLPA